MRLGLLCQLTLSMFDRKKIIIATIIAIIIIGLPITIPLSDNITLIIGGEDFSLIYFLRYFFIHIILVICHYLLILIFLKFLIRSNIYKIFLHNKKVFLLSMYIALFNSFITNSFTFEQFFSIDLNYTLRVDILSFFAYALINSYIIINTNKLINKFNTHN